MKDVPTREQLLHLLAEASELEHNLLCSYLFALFSLKDGRAGDLTPGERAAVGRWRKAFLGVCIEEMLHLAQVANLTVAIGGVPHFNRPNLPVAAGYHPAAVVVELSKFDLETLQHFIHLERPEGNDVPDGASFVPETPYRREAHKGALMPGSPDYETIGEFYAELQTKMALFCDVRGEAALFLGQHHLQMRPEEVRSESLHVVDNLSSATTAIEEIVKQGEGAPGQSSESHFAQFDNILQEYEKLLKARPDFEPAYPVGRNPVMRFPVATPRTHVTEPEAYLLLDAANAIYGFMLRCLSACYETPWTSPERVGLLTATFTLMKALSLLGSEVARRPAGEGASGNAGVSFAMMRSTEGVGAQARAQFLKERAEELTAHVDELPLSRSHSSELRSVLGVVQSALSGGIPDDVPQNG